MCCEEVGGIDQERSTEQVCAWLELNSLLEVAMKGQDKLQVDRLV